MKTTNFKHAEIWELIESAVGNTRRLLLFGPPGTGKTHVAKNAPLADGTVPKVYNTTLTEDTPAAEIRGHFIPNADGGFTWMDGPGVKAWREGARLVINEIDRGSGDALTLMFALLDDPDFASLTLPTGETVTPAPGFHVVATMNGLPQDLPEALQDRFPVTLLVDKVAPGAIAALPNDLRDMAAATVMGPIEERVGIRTWLEFASLRETLPEDIAGQLTLGDRYQPLIWNAKVAAGMK